MAFSVCRAPERGEAARAATPVFAHPMAAGPAVPVLPAHPMAAGLVDPSVSSSPHGSRTGDTPGASRSPHGGRSGGPSTSLPRTPRQPAHRERGPCRPAEVIPQAPPRPLPSGRARVPGRPFPGRLGKNKLSQWGKVSGSGVADPPLCSGAEKVLIDIDNQ